MCLVWANWKYHEARLNLDVSLEIVLIEQKGRPGLEVDRPGMRDQQPRDEGPRPRSGRESLALDLDEGPQPQSWMRSESERQPCRPRSRARPPHPPPRVLPAKRHRLPEVWTPFLRPADLHPVTALAMSTHSWFIPRTEGRLRRPRGKDSASFGPVFLVFSSSRRSLRHRQLLGCLHCQK